MNRELRTEELRLQHARDRAALLALSLWGVGGYLLYLGWRAAEALPDRWGDIAVTAIYLVTFFYVFAFWPILVAIEKLFPWPTPTHAGPLLHGHDPVIHYHGGAPEHGLRTAAEQSTPRAPRSAARARTRAAPARPPPAGSRTRSGW
jgi:hypothetical protein